VAAGLSGLKLDPVLQGFLLCDSLVYPVVETAISLNVPIYFYTGTPVNALPLQLAELAQRYPEGRFIMGHTGNPDFWLDAPVALSQAANLWAELSYNLPGVVNRLVQAGFARRLIFGSDAPLTDLSLEVMKIQYWQVDETDRAAIMATNLLALLGRSEEQL
jgi:predicted TIM-barrel fold metal-dependent hydrolase